MSESLSNVLQNPAFQTGLGLIMKANPALDLALQAVSLLAQGWQTQSEINEAIRFIDNIAAEHVKRLLNQDIHPKERSEIEIRLHEDLTILMKLGVQ